MTQRDGNDLIYTATLSLADALCGTTLRIQHLDGTEIEQPIEGMISPNDIKVIRCVLVGLMKRTRPALSSTQLLRFLMQKEPLNTMGLCSA